MKVAAFSSMFLTLFEIFVSNWLDNLKAATVESLSSQRQTGISNDFSMLEATLLTE